MSGPKFMPTGSAQELAAFLRARAAGHAHNPDIVVYAKPTQWAEIAEFLELAAKAESTRPPTLVDREATDIIRKGVSGALVIAESEWAFEGAHPMRAVALEDLRKANEALATLSSAKAERNQRATEQSSTPIVHQK